MATKYDIKLISKHADFDAEFKGIPADSEAEAGALCLRMMANPDAWLVVEADPLRGEADYMKGYNAAVSGVHEVHTHGDGISDVPEFVEDESRPICRIAFVDDPGDASVGLPHCQYWALTDDQSGTLLADLLRDYRPEGK